MIKTMLLTAQLALSPIVGTNGLQPKRANTNPYTEVDTKVVVDGYEYQRVLYGKEAWIQANTTINLGQNYTYSGNETKSEGFEKVENVNPIMLINTYNNPSRTLTANSTTNCFSFYVSYNSPTAMDRYVEVVGKTIYFYLLNNETIETYNTSMAIYQWDTYFYFKADTSNAWLESVRKIPATQPTKNSPTLYNTIYDFYEGTIFNGAGIAEYSTKVGENEMTMQQWLSHTATMATISLLCVAVAILVIKIFKLIAGSISDIWG